MISSNEDTLPSMIPPLISNAFASLANSSMIFAGATTSSLLNATAVGPVNTSSKPSNPAFLAARERIEFLITFISTFASRSCLRKRVTSSTVKPR